MYTLYYLNRNYQTGTIKVRNLDAPVRIPEDLVFSNLRKGIEFIKEPHECIDFTDTERLIMASEFTDTQLLKESDFRKQNSYLTPLCAIEPRVLTISFASSTSAQVVNIQQEIMDKIYSCSGDVGVTMHIISYDGIERTYPLSWLNFVYDNSIGGYRVNVVEPHEIARVWFSDDSGVYSDSNTFTVVD